MTESVDRILAHVVHARAVPASARERFAADLRGEPAATGLLLETCHRVELYEITPGGSPTAAAARRTALPDGGSVLRGEAAVRHALAVAVGRDSVVVGEGQVLHQLREAVATAQAEGALDPTLLRLFTLALRAGRRARSWGRAPSRSLADVTMDRLRGQIGGLDVRRVLVVGRGEMGRLAARAALAAGADVSIASRSAEGAAALASAVGASVEAFDPEDRAASYDAIAVALRGPWSIGARTIEVLAACAAAIVDLSVPAAIPEPLAVRLGSRLTTADDLARDGTLPGEDHASRRALARLDALVDQTATEFLIWLRRHDDRRAASALVERADAEREAELTELWRRLPDLDPEARATIEGMSRHLAERLLREPLERLGADADGRHERAVRELWAL